MLPTCTASSPECLLFHDQAGKSCQVQMTNFTKSGEPFQNHCIIWYCTVLHAGPTRLLTRCLVLVVLQAHH